MKISVKNGVKFLTFSLFENKEIVAAVSCRVGGISDYPFTSLNTGLTTGEKEDTVLANRKLFLDTVGIPCEDIVSSFQVHGTHVEDVGTMDKGRGALSASTSIEKTDGLITKDKNVPLTMKFADCTPLFFYDPVKEVIALSHGGWRGTAGNIAGKTIEKMVKEYGCKAKNILCAIGPTISKNNFEVGPEVVEAMAPLFTEEEMKELATAKSNGKFYFDLPKANLLLMRKAGILAKNIEDCGLCTYERNDLFFSYRKEHGNTGRHMAVLSMKG